MEADQLTVELTNKNDFIKKLQMKYTKMETELYQAQAMARSRDESAEQYDTENSAQYLSPSNPKAKKGVKSYALGVQSFFAKKFSKNKKGGGGDA